MARFVALCSTVPVFVESYLYLFDGPKTVIKCVTRITLIFGGCRLFQCHMAHFAQAMLKFNPYTEVPGV